MDDAGEHDHDMGDEPEIITDEADRANNGNTSSAANVASQRPGAQFATEEEQKSIDRSKEFCRTDSPPEVQWRRGSARQERDGLE